jgi:replication-associated recombination protein RarA
MKAKNQVSPSLTVRPEDQEAELVRLHQSTVRDALAIGTLLIEMRGQQPRGEWTAYLESVGVRTGISRASLFRYIKAVEEPREEKSTSQSPDFRKAKSPDGHDMNLLQSWLQKSIRRGDEAEALYAAREFIIAGFPGAVWNISFTTASEDIGLGERNLVQELVALHYAYKLEVARKSEHHHPWRLQLTHAVMLCVHAKKSRLLDHATICTFEGGEKRVPPEWVMDVHTVAGRSKGKTVADFFDTENPALNPLSGITDPYEAGARKLRIAKKEKTK